MKRKSDIANFLHHLSKLSQFADWKPGAPVAEFWESYDLAMLELREIEPVLELMRHYDGFKHNAEFNEWFPMLVAEVGELGACIDGTHSDHPHLELMQIAAIALNCLRLFSTNALMWELLQERLAKSTYRATDEFPTT